MSTVKCEWRVETFVIDDLIHQVDYRLAEWLNKLANEVVEPDYFFLEKLVLISKKELLAVVSIYKHDLEPAEASAPMRASPIGQ